MGGFCVLRKMESGGGTLRIGSKIKRAHRIVGEEKAVQSDYGKNLRHTVRYIDHPEAMAGVICTMVEGEQCRNSSRIHAFNLREIQRYVIVAHQRCNMRKEARIFAQNQLDG